MATVMELETVDEAPNVKTDRRYFIEPNTASTITLWATGYKNGTYIFVPKDKYGSEGEIAIEEGIVQVRANKFTTLAYNLEKKSMEIKLKEEMGTLKKIEQEEDVNK